MILYCSKKSLRLYCCHRMSLWGICNELNVLIVTLAKCRQESGVVLSHLKIQSNVCLLESALGQVAIKLGYYGGSCVAKRSMGG